ncbi:hypothetical protein J0S82_008878 [Galemys pyrenaicus]|uniref:Uncharacterized protein n=1 Tax=Galemys pyrenaicus TaxID=202257 RepID=A0A8J6A825_GALPY|nr:hypothetical protein J0S82_008878 [Galemys pyrenaicus]
MLPSMPLVVSKQEKDKILARRINVYVEHIKYSGRASRDLPPHAPQPAREPALSSTAWTPTDGFRVDSPPVWTQVLSVKRCVGWFPYLQLQTNTGIQAVFDNELEGGFSHPVGVYCDPTDLTNLCPFGQTCGPPSAPGNPSRKLQKGASTEWSSDTALEAGPSAGRTHCFLLVLRCAARARARPASWRGSLSPPGSGVWASVREAQAAECRVSELPGCAGDRQAGCGFPFSLHVSSATAGAKEGDGRHSWHVGCQGPRHLLETKYPAWPRVRSGPGSLRRSEVNASATSLRNFFNAKLRDHDVLVHVACEVTPTEEQPHPVMGTPGHTRDQDSFTRN